MDTATARSGGTSGLLLVNLGTPDDPSTSSVRRYLRQFLSDPRVIDIEPWRRKLLLNLVILPFRPRKSAEAYRKIWTERGSPLLFHGQDLAAKVRAKLPASTRVTLAMRYGKPSISEALDRLEAAGVDRIVVFPLYPQYSSAATGSTLEAVFNEAARRNHTPSLQVVPPFYAHPSFLEAVARVARPVLEDGRWERVLFSYHGLPERQIRKSDASKSHCLSGEECCERITEVNRNCYRAQCHATTQALGDLLGILPEKRILCFQSRLGRSPWIRPFTDEVVVGLARSGVKRVVVLSPAFVADCLETIEELGMRAAESFRAHGGEELRLVPCVNATDAWAEAVIEIARETSGWIPPPAPLSVERRGVARAV
jgi:ferrochelatase